MSAHEAMQRDEVIEGSSNRAFGLVFAGVFALVALWPLKAGGEIRWWAAAVAGLFLLVALALPGVLAPLNKAWTRLGLLMHRVVSPVVLGFMFFVVITPIGLLKRIFGTDGLGLTFDPQAESYWIKRDPPGPAPGSMKQQF